MKVHAALAKFLADNKVDTVFGLIGDGNLYLVHSFVHDFGGKFVGATHEATSALMALGYASVSGKLGVVSVTHGPGVTNTVSALVEGVKARLPLLLLCADTPTEDRDAFQNIPQREYIVTTGAGFERMRTPATALEDIATAFRRTLVERRPVALNIPREYQDHDVPYEPRIVKMSDARTVVPASGDLDDAAGIIASAKRPVIVAGRGAIAPEARAAVLKLAKRIGAPVSTTLKANCLFRGEEGDLGVFGSLSTPRAVDAIVASDCIIAFGAALNRHTTANGALIKGKRLVQVSQDSADIGRYLTPDAGLVGDPGLTADLLARLLDEAEIASSGYSATLAPEAKTSGVAPELQPVATLVKTFDAIDAVLPSSRMLVTDVGRFLLTPWKMLGVEHPRLFVNTLHSGSIGFAMAHAIGAAFAEPQRPVLAIMGDGGFMLGGLTEFHTAVRYKLDLVTVICNDSAYGAEHVQLRQKGLDPRLTTFEWPDFATVAQSMGGQGVTVRTEADIAAAVSAVRERSAPVLIDVKLDCETMPYFR